MSFSSVRGGLPGCLSRGAWPPNPELDCQAKLIFEFDKGFSANLYKKVASKPITCGIPTLVKLLIAVIHPIALLSVFSKRRGSGARITRFLARYLGAVDPAVSEC